ncbi:MAG: phosphatidylserine/phosphatidylglycerophosphate/cardiolipin synthase family protein [Candidatus Margulisbacteria bacterium]|nr:phosphatidylserine/phosphatidylglycerophosphate/cardiolipin synthase family protein [Candidatus Margulisiibacteriota bacterium]
MKRKIIAIDIFNFPAKTSGNTVTLLLSGEEALERNLQLIRSAKSSIHVQTLYFADDEVGRMLAEPIMEKTTGDMASRIINDGFHLGKGKKLLKKMSQAGVDIAINNPRWKFWKLNNRAHEKIFLIDGLTAIEGGRNKARRYYNSREVFDIDIEFNGPCVNTIQAVYLQNWQRIKGTTFSTTDLPKLFPPIKPLENGVQVEVFHSIPGRRNVITNLFEKMIHKASRLTLVYPYFFPPEKLNNALWTKGRTPDCAINIYTNGIATTDHPRILKAAPIYYKSLEHPSQKSMYDKFLFEEHYLDYYAHSLNGEIVNLWTPRDIFIHAKLLIANRRYIVLGSANMNLRSHYRDSEIAFFIDDENIAGMLEDRLEQLRLDHKFDREKIYFNYRVRDMFIEKVWNFYNSI